MGTWLMAVEVMSKSGTLGRSLSPSLGASCFDFVAV